MNVLSKGWILTLLIPLSFLFPMSLSLAEAATVRFEELPALVHQKNQHVTAAVLEHEAAQMREGLLGRSFLPQLEGYAGTEKFRTEGRDFPFQKFGGVQARLNLFDGFRDYFGDRTRKATSRLRSGELTEARAEELLKARRAYWELVYQRQLTDILGEALSENAVNLSAAKQRVTAGLATETDLLEFRMFNLQLSQDLQRAKMAYSAAEKSLSALIGSPPEITVDAEIPHIHADPLRQESILPTLHWSYSVLQAESEILDATYRARKNWWAPSLDLYAGYELFTFREEDELNERERTQVYGGIRLTIPLFDRLSGSTESRAGRLETNAASLRAQQTAAELEAKSGQIKTELITLHETLLSMETALPMSRDYLARTLVGYKRGAKTSPDVLGAVQKDLEIRRRVLDLKRDYQLRRAELLAFLAR